MWSPESVLRLTDHVAAGLHLLLDKYRGGQLYALATVGDSRPQEQRAEMLFHRAWVDIQSSGYFLVTATLRKKLQHFLVVRGDLDGIEIDHCDYS